VIFETFMDVVTASVPNSTEMHVYHYAPYDPEH